VELLDAFIPGPLERDLEAAGSQAFSSLAALRHEDRWRRMVTAPDKSPPDRTPLSRNGERLMACIGDVVAFAPAVRLLSAVGRSGIGQLAAVHARIAKEGTTQGVVDGFNEARRAPEAFLASLKAAHFLVRALQDAGYLALTELLGENPTCRYDSMHHASVRSPKEELDREVRRVLDERAPGYVAWFNGHKKLRDAFKEGVSTGAVFTNHGGKPAVVMGGGVSIETIDEALRQSIRLVDVVIEESERTRRARRERATILVEFAEKLEAGTLLASEAALAEFCASLNPRVEPTESRSDTIRRVVSRLRRCKLEDVRTSVDRATASRSR
jgi:hypothetical protein